MTFPHDYPYTNFHDLNLDWIMEKINELEIRVHNLEHPDDLIPIPDNEFGHDSEPPII